jgi:tetratricopeptide (TPR) repeat protein
MNAHSGLSLFILSVLTITALMANVAQAQSPTSTPAPVPSPTSTSSLEERLATLEGEMDALQEDAKTPNKDGWDKARIIAEIIAVILVPLAIAYVARVYETKQRVYQQLQRERERKDRELRERELRIARAELIEKFIPRLVSRDSQEAELALSTVTALGFPEVATILATLYPSEPAHDEVRKIAASPDLAAAQPAEDALTKTPFFRGIDFYNDGDYEQAAKMFSQAIERDPQHVTAYYQRGIAYTDLQDYQRAIEDFDRAIELDPGHANAYSNRGGAYTDLQDYQRAIEDFDRVIELNPGYAAAYYNKGCTYALMREVEQACEWLEKAINLDEKLRQNARTDRDFDAIRDAPAFQALVGKNSAE